MLLFSDSIPEPVLDSVPAKCDAINHDSASQSSEAPVAENTYDEQEQPNVGGILFYVICVYKRR